MEIDGAMPGSEELFEAAGADLPEIEPDADMKPDERWQADFKRRLLDAYDELFGGRS